MYVRVYMRPPTDVYSWPLATSYAFAMHARRVPGPIRATTHQAPLRQNGPGHPHLRVTVQSLGAM